MKYQRGVLRGMLKKWLACVHCDDAVNDADV
jgi:hypothetical protein